MRRREVDWDEAVLANQEIGQWVRHTDTKAALLAAGLGVIAAAVITQADQIAETFVTPTGWTIAVTLLLIGTLGAFAGVLRYVSATVRPHVDSAADFNRFAWPSLARDRSSKRSGHYESSAEEAWGQAIALAIIASVKYDAFATASKWFVAFLTSAIALVVIAFVA